MHAEINVVERLRLLINTLYSRSFGIVPPWTWACAGGLLGLVVGLGLFTFIYAQGISYMSNDPAACVNCHVMRDVYDGWNNSSHKAVATCNDCHIPKNTPANYLAKGVNGWHHSLAFTTDVFHEPIQIKKYNRDIAQQNCLRCHGGLVDSVIHVRSKEADWAVDCIRCHQNVGH